MDNVTVSAPESSFAIKLLVTCENRLFFLHVDKPTRFRGVQHSLLDVTFTKDPSDISYSSNRNPLKL